jgi:hypothetical protein
MLKPSFSKTPRFPSLTTTASLGYALLKLLKHLGMVGQIK